MVRRDSFSRSGTGLEIKLMLAVIVVSYNTQGLLRGCLTSVFDSLEQSEMPGEVWVVDNASSDGSPDMVREEFPAIHLIANTENLGFAAANNQALRALGIGDTTGPRSPQAVLLLNPDTVIRDDALEQMYRTLMSDARTGVTGASLIYSDGSFQEGVFRFPDLFQVFFDFFPINHRLTHSPLNGRYARSLYRSGDPFPVDHPLGAVLMARWAAAEQVGLMDERFFIYCEEIDWCMRFKQKGWRVICVPQAKIVHYAGQSTQQFRDTMFVALWKSRFLLFEKHYPPTFRRVARLVVSLGMKRKIRRARSAVGRGEMDRNELEKLEAARYQIMEIAEP